MAKKASVKIEGLDELVKAFANFGGEAMESIAPAINEAGELVLARTKELVPEKSGQLKRSLYLKIYTPSKTAYKLYNIVTWGDDVRDYAMPLELGHNVKFGKDAPIVGRAPARPFMRPAADKSKREVVEIVTDAMNEAIDKIGGDKVK